MGDGVVLNRKCTNSRVPFGGTDARLVQARGKSTARISKGEDAHVRGK